jgi:hypothetical protein
MSADDLPDLGHDVLAAVRDARKLVEPDEGARARMRSRLLAALPPPPGDGGGEGEGGRGGSRGGDRAAPAAPGLPKVPLWTLAAALAVGGAAGLLYPRAPVERVVTVQAPPVIAPPITAEAASAPEATLPSISMKDLPSAPPLVPSGASTATVVTGGDLAAERALLDVARTALGRGDGASSLVACDEHARTFVRGALAEEREAIAVQALVLEGRGDDARARAERFRRTHPRSILLPAVLAAAGVSP